MKEKGFFDEKKTLYLSFHKLLYPDQHETWYKYVVFFYNTDIVEFKTVHKKM